MSNILQYANETKALSDIKQSLKSVGCDICGVTDLSDVSKVIKDQLVTGPNAVINASLQAGPGIKIAPIDRKGYKISANDNAYITQDLTPELQKGTSVHKVLFDIIHKIIPDAAAEAAYAPSILDVNFVKVPYDGVDYYPLRGRHGNGRKTGLRPNTWYTRITLNSQEEPMYVDMGNVIAELREELLNEALHMVDSRIEDHLNHRLASFEPAPKPKPEPTWIFPEPEPIPEDNKYAAPMHMHHHHHEHPHFEPERPFSPSDCPVCDDDHRPEPPKKDDHATRCPVCGKKHGPKDHCHHDHPHHHDPKPEPKRGPLPKPTFGGVFTAPFGSGPVVVDDPRDMTPDHNDFTRINDGGYDSNGIGTSGVVADAPKGPKHPGRPVPPPPAPHPHHHKPEPDGGFDFDALIKKLQG